MAETTDIAQVLRNISVGLWGWLDEAARKY